MSANFQQRGVNDVFGMFSGWIWASKCVPGGCLVFVSPRFPLCGKQAGASRTLGRRGMISHLSLPQRDKGSVLSKVKCISMHREPFNGAENLPSGPGNPPWNSRFKRPVTTGFSIYPIYFHYLLIPASVFKPSVCVILKSILGLILDIDIFYEM